MSFQADVDAFALKVERRSSLAFAGTVTAILESIRDGSALTGAPGQPVDTGNLRDSWQPEFTGRWSARVYTNVEYAPFIEYGGFPGMPTGRSPVGGYGSVRLTLMNADKLVRQAVKVARGA